MGSDSSYQWRIVLLNPLESMGDFPATDPFPQCVCVITSQAMTPLKNNVVIICSGFYLPDPGPVYGSSDPLPFPIDLVLSLTYIINPPSGMPHCSSVT